MIFESLSPLLNYNEKQKTPSDSRQMSPTDGLGLSTGRNIITLKDDSNECRTDEKKASQSTLFLFSFGTDDQYHSYKWLKYGRCGFEPIEMLSVIDMACRCRLSL